jgi:hypothetical protein
MLSGSMPVFNKTKMGAVAQNLPDFILYDVVFAKELLNEISSIQMTPLIFKRVLRVFYRRTHTGRLTVASPLLM